MYTDQIEDDTLGTDPNRARVHTSMYANLRTNLPREVRHTEARHVECGESQDTQRVTAPKFSDAACTPERLST